MMTPVLTNGEAADIAVVAGKGAKVQEIGLKKQASRWPSAYPIACRCRLRWELPQRRRRACGGDCRKPAACPCRPFLSYPLGEERAADALHASPEALDPLSQRARTSAERRVHIARPLYPHNSLIAGHDAFGQRVLGEVPRAESQQRR